MTRFVIEYRPRGATEWTAWKGDFPDRVSADRHLMDLGGRESLDPTGLYRVVEVEQGRAES